MGASRSPAPDRATSHSDERNHTAVGGPSAALHAPLPDRVGGFAVEGWIGRGAMADVLRVRDPATGALQAMKLLSPDAPRYRIDRFQAEICAMRTLSHPNVPRFYGAGLDEALGRWFAVLELARHGSAADVVSRWAADPAALRERSLGLTRWITGWVVQALCALSAAHAAGIVHRDVKPANLLIAAGGRAMLSDFGVAHVPDLGLDTAHDAVLGTPSTMAPEQRRRPDTAGPSADLYAAGATLFRLATGQTSMNLFLEPPSASRWETLPEALRPIVIRATQAEPADRFADAREMALALAPFVPRTLLLSQPHLASWLALDARPRSA